VPAGEQRIGGPSAAFGEPGTGDRGRGGGQRGDPLLAAFAQAADVRSGVQADVGAAERGEFGDPQAGLDGQDQQGVIAATGPGVSVRGGEKRGDLGLGEVGDQPAIEAFGGDRQDALDDCGVLGVAQRGEPEQCARALARCARVVRPP